jgi:hypothetical protein
VVLDGKQDLFGVRPTLVGEVICDPPVVGCAVLAFDPSVALQTLEGLVDLPDVDRRITGEAFVVQLQLVAVRRSSSEEGDEGVTNSHDPPPAPPACMSCMHTKYV